MRRKPEIEASCVPAWTRQILLFQIGVVYVFAGLAKIDADWLEGRPMSVWLSARSHYPLIGGLLDEPWLPVFLSRWGALFDLLVVPAMLWGRTRNIAFTLAVLFHLANVSIFGIGTFPWFSLMMTALFYPPDLFRKLPMLRSRLPAFRPVDYAERTSRRLRQLTAAVLILYAAVQLLVPLRHFGYPGPTSWTEAGHMFSWRMMLRSKRGALVYHLRDPATNRSWPENPRVYLTPHQYRDMIGKPRMIMQFAHFLAERYEKQGIPGVEVTASCNVSLNGRPYQQFVRPGVDLTLEQARPISYEWIVPLREE